MIEAGVDEVGRGCLAGPVVAAAVILGKKIDGLRDSKKLSSIKRANLYQLIKDNSDIGIGLATNEEIDGLNIHNASLLAMKRSINNLKIKPEKVFVDGRFKIDIDICNEPVIGGDDLIANISAASIVAKVYRDRLMEEYDHDFPGYNFMQHKGYPTKDHLNTLKKIGPSNIHRLSFRGVK